MRGTISVPDRDVSIVDQVAPGVAGLRILMVNVYAIGNPDGGWVLVDAGLPFSAGRIRAWVESVFGSDARPQSILLTHGHFDHVGAVKTLAREWDVPVYAHPLEMPYLNGRSPYPPPDPAVGGGALAWMAPLYPRGPIDIREHLREYPADGSIPGLTGWRWIHTPGHTAGHVSLFRDEDRVLIAGDAFVTTKQESLLAVATQRAELHGPPTYYTSDWDAARQSVERLAGLFPNVLATGHGQPFIGPEATDALDALAARFDDWERPWHGRYGHDAAITNERGVVWTPPAVPNRMAALAAAALVGGALLFALSRRRAA